MTKSDIHSCGKQSTSLKEPSTGEPLARRLVLPLVLGVVAAVLSTRPLPELDLGWHLATGDWILQHRTVPGIDPFSDVQRPWVAYSWLFDVALAKVFAIAGFAGLHLLQSLLIVCVVYCALGVFRQTAPAGSIVELLALGVFVFCVSPFLYLRPQLVSVCLLLLAANYCLISRDSEQQDSDRGGMILGRIELGLLALTVIWANIHVYWVAVPCLFALRYIATRAPRDGIMSVACVVAAALNPYGFILHTVVWEYALHHSLATSLILEFQHLDSTHGIYFYCGLVILSALFATLWQFRAAIPKDLLLFVVLSAVAAMYQIKYYSLLGVATILLVAFVHRSDAARVELLRARRESLGDALLFFAPLVLLFVGLPVYWSEPYARTQRSIELDNLIASLAPGVTGSVLSDFNDGGALAWSIRRHSLHLRTQIDGRTLVMGDTRLAQWSALSRGQDVCNVLSSLSPDAAVVERESALRAVLGSEQCGAAWSSQLSCGRWELLLPPEAPAEFVTRAGVCSAGIVSE